MELSTKEKFELWELLNPAEAEKLMEERKDNFWRMIPPQFFPCERKPDSPKCAECGQYLRHERMRFFEDGACHVWSCGNEACSKWNLIKNTEANSQHNK